MLSLLNLPMSDRQFMIEHHLKPRGVDDPLVLEAMGSVAREEFIPLDCRELAYADSPLPIGEGQTISQPYIVALMAQAAELAADARVLEIGCGSGYGAAILGAICEHVVSIERIPELAERARAVLDPSNIEVVIGDGSVGYAKGAPYDAIIVTAAAPSVPPSLLEQLKIGGRLVIPIGERGFQQLIRVRKFENEVTEEFVESVRFVPLIGEEGF